MGGSKALREKSGVVEIKEPKYSGFYQNYVGWSALTNEQKRSAIASLIYYVRSTGTPTAIVKTHNSELMFEDRPVSDNQTMVLSIKPSDVMAYKDEITAKVGSDGYSTYKVPRKLLDKFMKQADENSSIA